MSKLPLLGIPGNIGHRVINNIKEEHKTLLPTPSKKHMCQRCVNNYSTSIKQQDFCFNHRNDDKCWKFKLRK